MPWLKVDLQTACSGLDLQGMVILWHDTAGIFSPVLAGFILLPGGLGKPFKQGTPTSAVQLESVRQPLHRTWDMATLSWNEKGRVNLKRSFLRIKTQFTNDFPQWKWKDARIGVRRERWGIYEGVTLSVLGRKKNGQFTKKSVNEKIRKTLRHQRKLCQY